MLRKCASPHFVECSQLNASVRWPPTDDPRGSVLLFRIGFGSLLLGLCALGCVADAPDTNAPAVAIAAFSEDTLALKAEVVVARDILQAYAEYGVLVDSVFAVAEAA